MLLGLFTLLLTVVMGVARVAGDTQPPGMVAFRRYDGIYVASTSGDFERRLWPIEPPGHLVIWDMQWSSDGQWLIFHGYPEIADVPYSDDIYRIDTNGKRIQNLTSSPALVEQAPIWSPDGNWIAFVSNRNKGWGLYVTRPDGSDIRLLVDQVRYNGESSWSPDSAWIANSGMFSEGSHDVYRVRVDGTGLQQLTFGFFAVLDIAWSPDGDWIYFSGRSEEQAFWNVFRVRSDGSEVQQIISEERTEWRFDRCSPDGEWITASRQPSEWITLYRMRPDGTEMQIVAPEWLGQNRFFQEDSSWSADGRWIAFEGTVGYDYGIFITSLASDEIQRLPHPGWDPVWSPPIDLPFRRWIVLPIGVALVLAGIAPWPRIGRQSPFKPGN